MLIDRHYRYDRVPKAISCRKVAMVQRVNRNGFLERTMMDITFGLPKGYTEVTTPGFRANKKGK